MRYVNDYDLQTAERWTERNAALRSAVQTISDLMDWTDGNSDGWAYWLPPRRAAQKLIELVWGDDTNEGRERALRTVSAADVNAALRPIKAFRTKVTKRDHGYGTRDQAAMPWWPVTAGERDAIARKKAEDESWPAGKTFGELTPEQKAHAGKLAARKLQAELEANADTITRILQG